MTRKLRIALSVFVGVLTLLLVVLWVRSNHRGGEAFDRINTPVGAFHSIAGHVFFFYFRHPITPPKYSNNAWRRLSSSQSGTELGFHFDWSMAAIHFIVPYWFILLPFAAATILPWCRCSFSLRSLLIATTLLAMALGFAVWAGR